MPLQKCSLNKIINQKNYMFRSTYAYVYYTRGYTVVNIFSYPVGVVADGEPTLRPSKLAKCDSKASSKLLGALN